MSSFSNLYHFILRFHVSSIFLNNYFNPRSEVSKMSSKIGVGLIGSGNDSNHLRRKTVSVVANAVKESS